MLAKVVSIRDFDPGMLTSNLTSEPGTRPRVLVLANVPRLLTQQQEAIGQFLGHYHRERNHQGLGNRLIDAGAEVGCRAGAVHSRERLGGILRYYYRPAA